MDEAKKMLRKADWYDEYQWELTADAKSKIMNLINDLREKYDTDNAIIDSSTAVLGSLTDRPVIHVMCHLRTQSCISFEASEKMKTKFNEIYPWIDFEIS